LNRLPLDEHSNDGRRRDHLAQQLQLLRPHLHAQRGHACEISAGSVEARDKSNRYRVGRDNRNHHGGRLCRECRRIGGRGNHVHSTTNQIGRQGEHSIVLALGPAVLDRCIVVLDPALGVRRWAYSNRHWLFPLQSRLPFALRRCGVDSRLLLNLVRREAPGPQCGNATLDRNNVNCEPAHGCRALVHGCYAL
jgi:hypothetical protein